MIRSKHSLASCRIARLSATDPPGIVGRVARRHSRSSANMRSCFLGRVKTARGVFTPMIGYRRIEFSSTVPSRT